MTDSQKVNKSTIKIKRKKGGVEEERKKEERKKNKSKMKRNKLKKKREAWSFRFQDIERVDTTTLSSLHPMGLKL